MRNGARNIISPRCIHTFTSWLLKTRDKMPMSHQQTQWLMYAIASGGRAAMNGVFAKLTTTKFTTTWATAISHLPGADEPSTIVEFLVKGVC